MTEISIEDRIKDLAAKVGFDTCGITSADPPPHHDYLKKWLADGNNGEMSYLERHEPKRGDLNQLLPGAKSVVVVGLSYADCSGRESGSTDQNIHPNIGIIARYARRDDYHNLIWNKLSDLLDEIKLLLPNTNGRFFCDTGPVSERDLAERTGIGWVGKHASLISRKLGNWFFLGEIILDTTLVPDTPEAKHCGTCSRCLPACPTGAITAPYHLDARRCIAYLTIELKGSIPLELRPLVGNRVFGCDDCLAVCPWNKFAKAASAPEIKPRKDLLTPDLIELLKLDDNHFKKRFDNSPILRTKRRGLARNTCVALGNVGDSTALSVLDDARQNDPEPLVQEHAEWAIVQIKNREKQSRNHDTI